MTVEEISSVTAHEIGNNMGLQNPIEFFNDEYMPSFYFDRLEMSKDVGGKR